MLINSSSSTFSASNAASGSDDAATTAELDAGDLVRGWSALQNSADTTPVRNAVIAWGARSDIGRARENNEDKFDFFLPDDAPTLARRGRLWAVADGMGGHNAGQVASEAALKTVVRAYFKEGHEHENTGARLQRAINEANALIVRAAQQFPDRGGMGTTVTVAAVRGDTLTIGHVGDSRAYLLRENENLRQITQDHSWVEEQVRRGALSRAEAENSPYRNVITRSVGMEGALSVDVFTETLRANDVVLLCSDGLSGYLDGPKLVPYLEQARRFSPSEAALALVDAANDAGGRDNISALLLVVRAVEDAAVAAPPAGVGSAG